MVSFNIKDNDKFNFFRFKVEGENVQYIIPQSVRDGTDTINFTSNWESINLPGSTEPMVAFNYVNAPSINVNLKFHEDMWREIYADLSFWDNHSVVVTNLPSYTDVISKFASLIYPSVKNQTIKSPYCTIYFDGYIYRGYFTNIRINQSGIIRNGHKVECEITSSFTAIKRTSPTKLGVSGSTSINGFRSYFTEN